MDERRRADLSRYRFERAEEEYEDYYEVTPEAAQEQINNAEYIISTIKPYLESCWAKWRKNNERNIYTHKHKTIHPRQSRKQIHHQDITRSNGGTLSSQPTALGVLGER